MYLVVALYVIKLAQHGQMVVVMSVIVRGDLVVAVLVFCVRHILYEASLEVSSHCGHAGEYELRIDVG